MKREVMKKALIFMLLFGLTGCNNKAPVEAAPTVTDAAEDQEEKPEIETVTLNEYGAMDRNYRGSYELIFDGDKTFKVNNDYLIDMFALEFKEAINIDAEETAHLSGEFRYTYANKNYVVKLNTINIGFFYMGEGGEDFFHIVVEDNQIRYWMRSDGEAELEINKIWMFIPNEME